MLFILLIIIILITISTIKLGSIELNFNQLKLLRILFPSWRFFEGLTPIPKAQYKLKFKNNTESVWINLDFHFNTKFNIFKNLIHNPIGNLATTYQVQIEQFLNDLAENSLNDEFYIEKLASFKIINSFILNYIIIHHPADEVLFYDFKIGVYEFNSTHFECSPEWSDSLLAENNSLKNSSTPKLKINYL